MYAMKRLLFLSPWLYRLLRTGIALIFVWAGAVKLMDPKAFARTISGYGLVPDELLVLVAIGLPALEFIVGACLLFDVRGSLAAVSGLLAIFIAVLGYGIFMNLDVDCGCFSPEEIHARDALEKAFHRDLGMMVIVCYLFLWRLLQARITLECGSNAAGKGLDTTMEATR